MYNDDLDIEMRELNMYSNSRHEEELIDTVREPVPHIHREAIRQCETLDEITIPSFRPSVLINEEERTVRFNLRELWALAFFIGTCVLITLVWEMPFPNNIGVVIMCSAMIFLGRKLKA